MHWRAITKRQPMLLYLLPHNHPMFVFTFAQSGHRAAGCRQLVCIFEAKRAQLRAPPWQGGKAQRLGEAGGGLYTQAWPQVWAAAQLAAI